MDLTEEQIEYNEWKENCLRDEKHQKKIYDLCESYKKKQINYKKECIIQNKIIYIKPKNYNDFVDFLD